MFKLEEKHFKGVRKLDVPPLVYSTLIKQLNLYAQEEIRRDLAKYSSKLGAITLLTPGSDGRLEKGSMASKLEVIALVDAGSAPRHLERVIRGVFGRILPQCSISLVEVKTHATPLMRFNANGRMQPARVQDGRELYGTGSHAHRTRLGHEIIKATSDDIKKVVDLERDARKVTDSGKNRIQGNDTIHFDMENGVMFYNPRANQLSFKIGPLRLVQSTLMVEAVRHVRQSGNAHFFEKLETGVVDRLQQLAEDRTISLQRSSAEEAAEHYAYFMRLYHRSEEAYTRTGGEVVAIQLRPQEVAEVKARLASLSALMKGVTIGK